MATSDESLMKAFMVNYDIRPLAAISDYMKCSICDKVMVDASYGPCECRYCNACIKSALNVGNEKKCPGSKELCKETEINFDTDIKTDECANIKISSLKIRCPNHHCLFEGSIKDLMDHLKNCIASKEQCPFTVLGCEFDGTNVATVQNHILNSAVNHSKLLVDCMVNFKQDLLKKEEERRQYHEMKGLMVTIAKAVEDQKMVLYRMDDRMRATQLEVHSAIRAMESKMELARLASRDEFDMIQEKMSELQENVNRLDQQLRNMDDLISVRSPTVKDGMMHFDDQQMIESPQEGMFVWRIQRLSQLRKEARTKENENIFSYPFLSSSNGYKFCLSFMPNSHGPWKGTHMRIGIALMRGPYDEHLQWPCRCTIEISVLRQDDSTSFKTKEFQYDSAVAGCRGSYDRPAKERNNSLGYDNFLSWADLIANSNVYKDDSICVRCRIIPPP